MGTQKYTCMHTKSTFLHALPFIYIHIYTLHIRAHTLHADFLFPPRLTHTIHTKCPLPLYMNNTNVFSSSPPSWKIRSVREPFDPSLWLYEHVTVKQREAQYRKSMCVCSCKCTSHKVLLFVHVYVCVDMNACVRTLVNSKKPVLMLWGGLAVDLSNCCS